MIIHLSNISIIRDFSEDNKGLIIKTDMKELIQKTGIKESDMYWQI